MRLNGFHLGLSILLVFAAMAGLGCPRPGDDATLRIVNDTSQNIVTVNVSLSTDASWGPNQISSAIPPGGSRDITGFSPDTYDARAIVANNDRATLWEFDLSNGETYTWTVTDQDLEPPAKASDNPDVEVYSPVDLK